MRSRVLSAAVLLGMLSTPAHAGWFGRKEPRPAKAFSAIAQLDGAPVRPGRVQARARYEHPDWGAATRKRLMRVAPHVNHPYVSGQR